MGVDGQKEAVTDGGKLQADRFPSHFWPTPLCCGELNQHNVEVFLWSSLRLFFPRALARGSLIHHASSDKTLRITPDVLKALLQLERRAQLLKQHPSPVCFIA